MVQIKKGDIFYADLEPALGSEQGGVRPVLIVQNNVGNKFSPTVIAAAITSRQKGELPTHVPIKALGSGLLKDSVVLLEQIRTLDKRRLKTKLGAIDSMSLGRINEGLSVSLGLNIAFQNDFDKLKI
ncbi:MAG: type II toxin-antitoxin system PemK/MazF family toxin [Oscillospiraceae bacterium]|jgi:mRNA interferase MazF|nr:type II toxin-antitoxin system PemK/MazF family toxin [Oscillospiraceae bacterium]